MSNLLKLSFWFEMRPSELAPLAQKSLIIFILILAILFITVTLLNKYRKGVFSKIYDRLSSLAITNFFIGLLLLFFTYELVPLLSARFWFLLWAAEMIVWIVFIAKNILEIPMKKELAEKEKEFKKYIP